MQGMSHNKVPASWLNTLVVVVASFGVLALAALPYLAWTKGLALRAEAKSSLHDIQLAVERYSTDHNGIYPSYLIGGRGPTAGTYRQPRYGPALPQTKPANSRASDVLIREGYLTAYPANPFARAQDRAESVLAMQRDVRTSITGNDPLRPGTPEAAMYGTRFGTDGRLMGQVLCDARFAKWNYVDGQAGAVEECDTWANIEYQFWDMWLDPRGCEPYLPFSPGQFFYKCAGFVKQLDSNCGAAAPLPPEAVCEYMLGAYGGLRTKGSDVLGEEPTLTYFVRQDRAQNATPHTRKAKYIELELRPWTRSQLDKAHKQGSPYGPSMGGMLPGDPNGIRDSLILVLISESGGLPYG